jgi:hypothetical protein
MDLKRFQQETVAAVIKGLRNGAYGLADETGLGKTVICSDVARALILDDSGDDPFVVFYVAPSIELLHQNLDSIADHLAEKLAPKEHYHIHRVVSRLTQIPLALANQTPGKKNVFVVGLSPETSFKINRTGKEDERAYLAALFGYQKQESASERIRDGFWCLPKPVDRRFAIRIAQYRSATKLGHLRTWTTTASCKDLFDRIGPAGPRVPGTLKADRALVQEIRREIATYLVRSPGTLPNLVLFDEWHKYKATCFEPNSKAKPHERLVADLLDMARRSDHSKVLFVSATPFTVDYDDLAGSTDAPASGDLRSLLQLISGAERFEEAYGRLREKQQTFVAAVSRLLAHDDEATLEPLKEKARQCCLSYENELRRYCVRTERPKSELVHDVVPDCRGWEDIFDSGSAKAFLTQFSRLENMRSPVVSMWMDGHDFPDAGYEGLKSHKISNIREVHWKTRRLLDTLHESFTFDDELHSFSHPPLWLPPEGKLRGHKHLIFSEFKFVPEEICRRVKAHAKVKTSANYSGSVLGFFPLAALAAKRSSNDQNLKRSIHFPLFYPFLFWELPPHLLEERLNRNRDVLRQIIRDATSATTAVLRIETMLVGDIKEFAVPVQWRGALVDQVCAIPATDRFREYLTQIIEGRMNSWAPGAVIARVVARQRARSGDFPLRRFEEEALQLASAVMRLFVSPEAQILMQQPRSISRQAKRSLPNRWRDLLRFALSYTRAYNLEGTLQDFAGLLANTGKEGHAVLAEIRATMSLKHSNVGTRYVRSFHDSKAGDTASSDEGEPVTTHSLRAAFNSPFPPYVLASTSVGQEGLDFHRYCDSVIHWTPPASPSALRQREGRVDRYLSMQVRIALAQLEQSGQKPDADSHGGLCPDFVVMHKGQRMNRAQRTVLYLPYTAQSAVWQQCLRRMHYDDLLIGAPDPLADERAWMTALERQKTETRERRFALLKEFSISLRPRPTKYAPR